MFKSGRLNTFIVSMYVNVDCYGSVGVVWLTNRTVVVHDICALCYSFTPLFHSFCLLFTFITKLTNATTVNCRPTNYRTTTSCHAGQQLYNCDGSFHSNIVGIMK